MTNQIKTILACLTAALLIGCVSTVQPVGELGPNHLKVFVIKNSDFLSASRMLVILDKKGNVSAYTGGTVSGAGTIGLQAAESVASAGAIVLGAQAIEHGLENASIKGIPRSLNVKGIPNSFNLNSAHTIKVTGTLKN